MELYRSFRVILGRLVLFVISGKEIVWFGVVVCLFLGKQDCAKTTCQFFMICLQGVAWAKEEPAKFWRGSDLQGSSKKLVSLLLMCCDTAFGPEESQTSLSPVDGSKFQ